MWVEFVNRLYTTLEQYYIYVLNNCKVASLNIELEYWSQNSANKRVYIVFVSTPYQQHYLAQFYIGHHYINERELTVVITP